MIERQQIYERILPIFLNISMQKKLIEFITHKKRKKSQKHTEPRAHSIYSELCVERKKKSVWWRHIHEVLAYIHRTVKVNDSVYGMPTFCSFSFGFCFCFWLMLILTRYLCTSLKLVSEKRTETRYRHKIGWTVALHAHLSQCNLMCSRVHWRHT